MSISAFARRKQLFDRFGVLHQAIGHYEYYIGGRRLSLLKSTGGRPLIANGHGLPYYAFHEISIMTLTELIRTELRFLRVITHEVSLRLIIRERIRLVVHNRIEKKSEVFDNPAMCRLFCEYAASYWTKDDSARQILLDMLKDHSSFF